MIRLFTSFVFVLCGSSLLAQNNVGIGTANPNPSAILDLSSDNKGMLVPRMSDGQMIAIVSPVNGLLVYNRVC